MFGNVNYSPEAANILARAIDAITPQNYTPFMAHLDPKRVAIGYALRAAERIHLKDWQIEQLFDALEEQMEYGNPEEMLGSDAVEVYERYEVERQAERDELERMDAESERNYLAELDAQRELNYEIEQTIEGRMTA